LPFREHGQFEEHARCTEPELVVDEAELYPLPPCGDEVWFRSEEHTSELQSLTNLVCRLLLEKKKKIIYVKSTNKKIRQSNCCDYLEYKVGRKLSTHAINAHHAHSNIQDVRQLTSDRTA